MMTDGTTGRARLSLLLCIVGATLLAAAGPRAGATAATEAPFSCATWTGARAHVLVGEAIEARSGDHAHHVAAIARYKAAVAACADYPWAWSDLQQSYAHLHEFALATSDGWRAIAVARRTKARWAWAAPEYRAFVAGCFDTLGWVEQMVASRLGPGARAYRGHVLAALSHFRSALFYDAHDIYADHHLRAIERYLAAVRSAHH